MSTAVATPLMTIEEFLALPDDGVDRELIRGEVRVRGSSKMTRRNRHHARAEVKIGSTLDFWLDALALGGEVVSGEAGFVLKPNTSVGIDVAYVPLEVAAKQPNAAFFHGPPVLAVEILSPSDKQEDIDEKVTLYLESGVKVVWIVNTSLGVITILRPNQSPEIVGRGQEIVGDPELPGFRAMVDQLLK